MDVVSWVRPFLGRDNDGHYMSMRSFTNKDEYFTGEKCEMLSRDKRVDASRNALTLKCLYWCLSVKIIFLALLSIWRTHPLSLKDLHMAHRGSLQVDESVFSIVWFSAHTNCIQNKVKDLGNWQSSASFSLSSLLYWTYNCPFVWKNNLFCCCLLSNWIMPILHQYYCMHICVHFLNCIMSDLDLAGMATLLYCVLFSLLSVFLFSLRVSIIWWDDVLMFSYISIKKLFRHILRAHAGSMNHIINGGFCLA